MWVVSQGDSSKSDLFLAFSFCEMLVEIRVHKFLLILEAPRQKWKAFWTLTIIWLLEVTQSTGSVFLLLLKNKVAVLLSFKVYLCLDPAQQPVVKVITSNSTVPQGPPQGIDGLGTDSEPKIIDTAHLEKWCNYNSPPRSGKASWISSFSFQRLGEPIWLGWVFPACICLSVPVLYSLEYFLQVTDSA